MLMTRLIFESSISFQPIHDKRINSDKQNKLVASEHVGDLNHKTYEGLKAVYHRGALPLPKYHEASRGNN